ncbi:MAG: hypothetical protein Q4F47_07000 [Bacteroidaceae bacterium]|nr:hypothetical protein [Bacteroidaceae bacterium]MDO5482769.1 hypothetical protein [Bacteroidaceae bacterium]
MNNKLQTYLDFIRICLFPKRSIPSITDWDALFGEEANMPGVICYNMEW